MLSQFRAVESLCATTMVVLPFINTSSILRISFSVFVSRALVASSIKTKGEPLSNARAMATRCFSPPLSFNPRSPTMVSYALGMRRMGPSMAARRAASRTSASDALILP